ncbi:MAG: hypothetical protein EOM68_15015 [Spirochaetia bacterium]|nr:hypothetical protein [Spirochaetia bacterium]
MKTIETMPNDGTVFIRIPQELKDIARRNNISFTDRVRGALIQELVHLYSDGMLCPADRVWVEEKILMAPLPKTNTEDGFWGVERGYLQFYKAVPADPPRDSWGNPKFYPQKMRLPVVIAHEKT